MDSQQFLQEGSSKLENATSNKKILAVVVMGVSSCGKSTIGKEIADNLNIPFEDGDKHHPEANISKMSAGSWIFMIFSSTAVII